MSTPPPDEAADRGFPVTAAEYGNGSIGNAGWHLHRDFETPIAVIDRDSVIHNATLMHRWITEEGAELWPHAKTVMSPELVRLQLEHGSVGMTAATMAQVRSLRAWGVSRVMLANQLVQPAAAAWIAADRHRDPDSVFWSFVDSPEGVRVLQAAAAAADTTLEVLIEVGLPGKRTGIRTDAQRDELVAALDAAPRVQVIGVAAYEGSCAADREESSIAAVDSYLERVGDHLAALISARVVSAEDAVFSAGGSMFFDRVRLAAERLPFSTRIVIRAGCYLLHDHGLYERATPLPDSFPGGGLRAALTVWGTVHSRPEPTRAYVDVGRRDASFDQSLPVPLRRLRSGAAASEPLTSARVISLNDHHAHLELDPASDVAIGDRIEFGISHPCTTMDKWRRIPLVEPSGAVVASISTAF